MVLPICTLSFCTFTAVSSLALSTKSSFCSKLHLKWHWEFNLTSEVGSKHLQWGFFISRYHDLQVRVSASSSTSDATGLGLPSVNTTSPYSSNNTSKSSSSSWLKSTSYNGTKFISLIPIVQFCSHLPLLSMGRLNMHTAHKGGLDTPVLVQIAKEFSLFLCYIYCKNKVWQNPQTLKLGASPNPSPLVAAAENIPQVLPFRHQFENLILCVVDVRCEEPDTVASWEKRWAQDGWRKDWYVSSVHSD